MVELFLKKGRKNKYIESLMEYGYYLPAYQLFSVIHTNATSDFFGEKKVLKVKWIFNLHVDQ